MVRESTTQRAAVETSTVTTTAPYCGWLCDTPNDRKQVHGRTADDRKPVRGRTDYPLQLATERHW